MDRRDLRDAAAGADRAFARQGLRTRAQGGKTVGRTPHREIEFLPGSPRTILRRCGLRLAVRRQYFRFSENRLDVVLIFRNTMEVYWYIESLERPASNQIQYFVVMIDYGRRGREGIGARESTR